MIRAVQMSLREREREREGCCEREINVTRRKLPIIKGERKW